jgi:hypothetical protein
MRPISSEYSGLAFFKVEIRGETTHHPIIGGRK